MIAIPDRIHAKPEQVEAFCRRWNVIELALFGSVVREDFAEDSDIDVMVAFAPGIRRPPFDFFYMKQELEALFGRKVDIVRKGTVENPFRRAAIARDLTVIYAA